MRPTRARDRRITRGRTTDRTVRRAAARTIALGNSGVLLALALPTTVATAALGNACDNRTNNTYEKLLTA